MGNLRSKSCVSGEKDSNEANLNSLPGIHFKCRYHPNDEYCKVELYTRTTNISRFPVPRNKINWDALFPEYDPKNFTSEKILKYDLDWIDPNITHADYDYIQFNDIDERFKVDRISFHGDYKFLKNRNSAKLTPRNPVGRTGLCGRGHLGRWKLDERDNKVKHPKTGKYILQFVSIQRRDTGEWAIPGGMVDPGEKVSKTLLREFSEEALSLNINDNINKDFFIRKLEKFFQNGELIYKGYVDDPRNTDNAWMETIACNFHDEACDMVGSMKLQGGDDATKSKWIDLSSDLKLFANHVDFLHEVAKRHSAHW